MFLGKYRINHPKKYREFPGFWKIKLKFGEIFRQKRPIDYGKALSVLIRTVLYCGGGYYSRPIAEVCLFKKQLKSVCRRNAVGAIEYYGLLTVLTVD